MLETLLQLENLLWVNMAMAGVSWGRMIKCLETLSLDTYGKISGTTHTKNGMTSSFTNGTGCLKKK